MKHSPDRSSRPRRAATILASLLLTASLAGVAPASSAAAAPFSCWQTSYRAATFNILGQVTHGATSQLRWCANNATHRISAVYPVASHQESILWNWVGWNGNYTLGGVGNTYYTNYIKGTFKECAAYCFNSASNWVKITVYPNGTYTVSGK